MDSALLQLFSADEVLDRIGRKKLTGCFHAIAPKDSAAVFFKDGLVISATIGRTEGEEALTQMLGWSDARLLWQPDTLPTSPAAHPLRLNISDFLTRLKVHSVSDGITPSAPTKTSYPVISIPSKGKSTGPLDGIGDSSGSGIRPVGLGSASLTATKTISLSAEARSAHDEALLEKHKLVLISTDEPARRLQLSRVSNLIGRNPACDLAIAHASISRQHCLLQITERGLHVKDLDTTNGTKVNGIMMKEGYVGVGDKLTMGHLTFVLERDKKAPTV